jgi:hypothetical protein
MMKMPLCAAALLAILSATAPAMAQATTRQGVGIIVYESNPAICPAPSSFAITYRPDPTGKSEGLRLRMDGDLDLLLTAPHFAGQGAYNGIAITGNATLHIIAGYHRRQILAVRADSCARHLGQR